MIEIKVDGENGAQSDSKMKTKDGGFYDSFNSLL
jgi:hypothetical protein